MSPKTIDICIPVLNEERRLERGVADTLAYCAAHAIEAIVTVADNGSTDGTAQVAARLQERYPNLRYVSVGERGVGRALKSAWGSSPCRIFGYMDVDLATDLKHLKDVCEWMLPRSDEAVIITGSRLLPGSRVENRKLVRAVTSRTFNWILRTALGVKFSDGMCGFKFLTRRAFLRLREATLDNDDWFFCTEILVKSEWLGIPLIEIPVHWVDDHDSRARIFSLAQKYLQSIAKLRREKDGIARLGVR